MADREVGYIELTATTRIIFAVGSWKGQSRASIRKFVATEKYAGPTKSGMSLDGATVAQLLVALRSLQSVVPSADANQHIAVGRSRDSEIRIAVVPSEEEGNLPSVDIREFVESPGYTGPTKKGVRIPWNKLKQCVEFIEVLVKQLGAAATSEATLFPDLQPAWVANAKGTLDGTEHKPALKEFDPKSVKAFPDAFLPEGKLDAESITLPHDPLTITQDRDGQYFVTDESEFKRKVRNEVEGKFLIYAHQRGNTKVRLPKEMFKIFSAVVGYEKYCRELRQKLVRELEARSRNRPLAEHIAQETMQTHGLP